MKARCPAGAMSLQFAAKKLAERGIDTGGHKIFKQLRNLGMLNGLHPSMRARHRGWMAESFGDWEGHGYNRVFITASGLDETERRLRNSASSLRLDAEKAAEVVETPLMVSDIDLGVERDVQFGF